MNDRNPTLPSREQIAERLFQAGLPRDSADRYLTLLTRFSDAFGFTDAPEFVLASAAGRTELAGNHTDHNRGRVLAASVHLDTIAVARARDERRVVIQSEGFPTVEINLDGLDPVPGEEGSTASLVRGVAAGFKRHGFRIGGFEAAASSRVLSGSGLSSSASFEVLVGTLFNVMYNERAVSTTQVAQIGKYAENVFFGKPSGLMDQVACASGGAVSIDFKDRDNPHVTAIPLSFADHGYALAVVDTGGSHADLTDEYAAIPQEMRAVAAELGEEVLSDVAEGDFYRSLGGLRKNVGDRAVNRAIHFFEENKRVLDMTQAVRSGDIESYVRLMSDSGHSSGLYLQNCAPTGVSRDQAVVTALALAEKEMAGAGLRVGTDAACRVHGGGFAGTIQLLLPADRLVIVTEALSVYLGSEAVTNLSIRAVGTTALPLA